MHILVTNDDGPPSTQSSPYVLSLVRTLQSHGHTVSVVLPNTQRSWISKAHIVGQAIKPTYYRPPHPHDSSHEHSHCDSGITSTRPLADDSKDEEWILVDSTPASCIQIGLFHYFKERGPVELVISGPNYGRNTTALFSLSSGTIGGAMEAAVCGVRSIALSYAFFDRNHDPVIIAAASRISVKIIEALHARWTDRHSPQLYSINVPLLADVEKTKVLWTRMLQNEWRSGSCFTEVEVPVEEDWGPEEGEMLIRRSESLSLTHDGIPHEVREELKAEVEANGHPHPFGSSANEQAVADVNSHLRYSHKHFKWSPRFKDVFESVAKAPPGNDGWAVKEGYVSVTPLRANFMHVDGFEGEFKF